MIGVRNHLHQQRLRSGLVLAAALLVAALAGVYSVGHPKRALAGGAILVIGLVLLDLNARRGTLVDRFRWIPWAWMALFLATDIRLLETDPEAVATGAVNVQHMIQLALYAIVTALAIRARGTLLTLFPRSVPKGLLLALPVVAVASAAWSLVPIYTLVRGLQLVVLAALALLVVRIWASDRAAGMEIFRRTLRLLVQVVTILIPIGFLFGAPGIARFTWPGAAPTLAATYVGAALLILVAGGRSFTGFGALGYWGRLALFAGTLYLAQTRSVLLGVVFGIGVALWFRGRGKPLARYLGVLYYVLGVVLVVVLASANILTYLSRGERMETLFSLTGRIPLWEFALGRFDSIRDWALGFGYGSSRVVLPSADFEWAGSAHSVWMEVLLGMGVLGVAATLAAVIVLAFWLAKRRRLFERANVVSLAILGYFLMISPILEAFVIPGLGFGLFALLHAPALADRATPPPRERHPASRSAESAP